MSPVQQTKVRDPRSLALALGGLIIGLVLLVVIFVWAVPKATDPGTIRLNTPGTLSLGFAESTAAGIRDRGPILYPDLAGGQRDVLVQHLGDDPRTGWVAFDARRPGKTRECNLRWDAAAKQFDDPCGGPPVPADGGDLPRTRIEVQGEAGELVLILATPATEPPLSIEMTGTLPSTTTTAAAPTSPAATTAP